MRSISFMWFKQNCKWLNDEYDFIDGDYCDYEHEHKEIVPGHNLYFCKCKEKYCPILERCEKL